MTSQEPEEPHLHSEASLLSPASPKPIHFPAPTNIPVLNKMMDVGFNQTELHMQDPAMRNTEIRDGAWKDPEDDTMRDESAILDESATAAAEQQQTQDNEPQTHPVETLTATDIPMMLDTTNDQATAHASESLSPVDTEASMIPSAVTADADSIEHPLHEHVPTEGSAPYVDASSSAQQPIAPNLDVQALLNSLQTASQSTTPLAASGDDQAASFLASLGAPPAAIAQPPIDPPSSSLEPLSKPPTDLAAALASYTPAANITPLPRALSSQRERKIAAGEPVTEDDAPWTPDIQLKYDDFIQEERKHVNAGNWDSFPLGSRLFIGNLSSDSVTKRDIFHVFHSYGPLAQISIKNAYGFVQFLRAEDCGQALSTEQGRLVKDKRIHLEISKPQKSRNNNNNQANRNRSRSPDRRRANHDRQQGSRDLHRYRSPSPRGGQRDRFDGRRSRSPPGYQRPRYGRSPSPQDELPLPIRPPHEVPDVQLIVRDNLDGGFIAWTEKAFTMKGLKVAVLLLTPRLQEDAVIRRQIVEGVLAISRLDHQAQAIGRINLRLFNRSRGTQNVSFDDYDNLEPGICAELVLRAKSTQAPAQHQYGYPPSQPPPLQYGYGAPSAAPPYMPPPQAYLPQSQYPAPPRPGQPSPLDMGSLQNLLATARNGNHQTPTPLSAPAGYPGYPPQQQQQQQQHALYQPPAPPPTAFPGYQAPPPSYGARPPPLPQGMPPAGPPKVDMQDILARLGSYNK